MSRRTPGLLAAFALIVPGLVVGLVAVGSSTPAAAGPVELTPIKYCTVEAPPCIEELTRDGFDIPSGSPTYRLVWNEVQPGSGFYSWFFEKFDSVAWTPVMGGTETTHVFKVRFNFGSFNPRTFAGQGDPAGANPVYRTLSGGDYRITITATPINRLTGCNTNVDPATCPTTASIDDEAPGYLDGVVNDGRWFGETAAEHQRIGGFYDFHNVQVSGGPPVITTDAVTGSQALLFTLRNVHEYFDGADFHGSQHLRLPNAMLREVYGIPDPDTMTWSSLAATVSGGAGGGTLHITPEDGHDAMRIDLTGVTFSARKVTVKAGIIKPTAPTALTGERRTSTTGFLDWDKSLARGARPTSYQSKCYTPGYSNIITTSRYTYATVTGLKAGKHYSCRVRARSAVGYSAWSTSVGKL